MIGDDMRVSESVFWRKRKDTYL